MNSEKLASRVLSLWSNPSKEPKLRRSCREQLGTFAGEGTDVCCTCGMIRMDGGRRVIVDNRGGSAVVMTRTSTRGVDLKIESIPSDRLRDEAQSENEDFLTKLDENIQKIIKEQVKVQVFKILPKIEKTVNEQLEAEYLPQTIWRQSDKDRAAAMIQTIDKQLKTMRIMRSLEKFVGGRLYEGDFRMLQRTR
nr:hypothetical protein [Tanacetum cinerariifolium]